MQESIQNFLLENSTIASNRTSINKDPNSINYRDKSGQACRYLNDNKNKLYNDFKRSNPLIKKSTFQRKNS